MKPQRVIPKWGFGMAPISSRMRSRYDAAVQTVLDVLYDNLSLEEVPLDDLSEFKGMCNRCLREDQWDWFSVFTELGEPPLDHLRKIVSDLILLRRSLKDKDFRAVEIVKRQLIRNNTCHFLHSYQNHISFQDSSSRAGWVYILSTREQPRILKIGMTQRSVSQRVNEINSATGVLIPFSARRVFRVIDALEAERDIHQQLQPYRVRSDREFFELDIGKATRLVTEYIEENRIRQRQNGTLLWFDNVKGYGFASSSKIGDVFLHKSEVRKEDLLQLQPGTIVQFDLGHSPRGPFAIRMSILEENL